MAWPCPHPLLSHYAKAGVYVEWWRISDDGQETQLWAWPVPTTGRQEHQTWAVEFIEDEAVLVFQSLARDSPAMLRAPGMDDDAVFSAVDELIMGTIGVLRDVAKGATRRLAIRVVKVRTAVRVDHRGVSNAVIQLTGRALPRG